MPVFEQSYRRFEGRSLHRFRWVVIIEQELNLLARQWVFRLLSLAALMIVLVGLLVIAAHDVIMQNPERYAAQVLLLKQSTALQVGEKTFYYLVLFQLPLVFLTSLYAGSGMICNDFRNNLMEIYFSKPISWVDYTLGKVGTLLFIGLAFTAIPGILLIAVHNLLLPSMDLLKESMGWMLAVLGFSLAAVVPCTLGILASSALLRSQNYAAIAVFMMVIADSAMGLALAGALRAPNYAIVSFPNAVYRVGEHLFHVQRPVIDLPWGWSLLFIGIVTVGALAIVASKVRRAEIAA